jgi:hypothetical protein
MALNLLGIRREIGYSPIDLVANSRGINNKKLG